MKIISNLGNNTLKTEVQLKDLNTAIMTTDISVNPLPWQLVSGSDYTTKYNEYELLKVNYLAGKAESKLYRHK